MSRAGSILRTKLTALGWAAIAAACGVLALAGLGYGNRDIIVLAVTFGGVALGVSSVVFAIDWARKGAGPAAPECLGSSALTVFLVIFGAIVFEGFIAFFFSSWLWLSVVGLVVVGVGAGVVARRRSPGGE